MIINDLKIDGFGVWHGLRLDRLTGQVNVFYGPNEAGKTTLLEFVRAVLYGFSDERRRRYLPPLGGGVGGGSVALGTSSGVYDIARRDTGEGIEGQLRVTDDAGLARSPSALRELLRNLQEPVFNHVFALGLEELQELGTLSDAEVAARLYHLSTGLRGITLAEVLHELDAGRRRILAGDDQTGELSRLLTEREVLRAELHELRKLTQKYSDLSAERDGVDQSVAELESNRTALSLETRLVELAIRIRPLWERRAELDHALTGRTMHVGVGADVVTRFDAIKDRLRSRKQQLHEIEPEVERVRASLAGIAVNDALWRQGPRIETLCDQQEWIATLESQLGAAELEASDLEAQQKRLAEQIGWKPGENLGSLAAPPKSLATLRPVARAQHQAHSALKAAQEQFRQHRESSAAIVRQIAAGLVGRPETELAGALDKSGERVNQLRRRVQLDERLDQLQHNRKELEEDNRELRSQDMLSPRTLVILATTFAVGVMLLLAGLLLPTSWTGGHGLGLAFIGLCAGVGAVVAKLWLERNNERNLDTCTQQLSMVKRQIEEATEERDELDKQLPHGGGPLLARLQAAEKDLTALEELLPLETRRQSSEREAQAAEQAAQQAEAELAASRRRWQELLVELGLPASARPRQLRALRGCTAQWRDVANKLAARQQEIGDRRRALESLVGRLDTVFEETKIVPSSPRTIERLRQLRQAVAEQGLIVGQRDELRKRLRKLRRRAERLARLVDEFKLRRRTILQLAGVDNEPDFRARAAEQAETNRLQQELTEVRADLAAALADQTAEEAIRPLLEQPSVADLDHRWERVATELSEVEAAIRHHFELRGQLNEQLKVLAADRRPSEKRLEFDLLNERLAETIRRWQVMAVTHRLLDAIRDVYQRERQPATLKAASRYFERMTGGRYTRVWTPMSDDVLMVDDAQGYALSIEVLSRGTREQLFLSLRLALAADYAARGQSFPLVFDDLLVNFDTERARATAEVLKDFAAAGHQVLVFTCHEHIKRLFQHLGVRVRRLPDNTERPASAVFDELEPESLLVAAVAVSPIQLPAPSAMPVVAGEAGAFRGWPVNDEVDEELVTIEDHSSFWTLVARTRPWNADGAEEFAGEFAERIVEEIRQPASEDRMGSSSPSRSRLGRRRRPAGARATDARAESTRPPSHEGTTNAAWDDDPDSEAA